MSKSTSNSSYVDSFMARVKAKNPAEPEFHQAVQEVVESLDLVLERYPEYRSAKIMERMVEPERVIMFRVAWLDDQGEIQINRGFRIQMNSIKGKDLYTSLEAAKARVFNFIESGKADSFFKRKSNNC